MVKKDNRSSSGPDGIAEGWEEVSPSNLNEMNKESKARSHYENKTTDEEWVNLSPSPSANQKEKKPNEDRIAKGLERLSPSTMLEEKKPKSISVNKGVAGSPSNQEMKINVTPEFLGKLGQFMDEVGAISLENRKKIIAFFKEGKHNEAQDLYARSSPLSIEDMKSNLGKFITGVMNNSSPNLNEISEELKNLGLSPSANNKESKPKSERAKKKGKTKTNSKDIKKGFLKGKRF